MINKIVSIKDYSNLQEYKFALEKDFIKARNGKDINCKKCDDSGVIKAGMKRKIGEKIIVIDTICDCVSDEKTKIEEKIQNVNAVIRQYREIFGNLEENITLDKYAKEYKQSELTEMLKNYLEVSSPASLFFAGESKSGKTTLLKMLWQIYTINNVKVFYLKASYLEKLYKQLYTSKTQNDIQTAINTKIANAKKCDILLIDDLDSISFATAKNGYYEIFDYLNRHDKKVIIASTSYIEDIANKLKEKKDRESIRIADKIISRMLGLGLIQIELKKYVPKATAIINRKKIFDDRKEA